MPKPTLYLMVGYPGSGKTTAAQIICRLTGAEHIWADAERKRMFAAPTHSQAESRRLYDYLNAKVADLLAAGKSVVFDTNFNYYKDRELLRSLAQAEGAAVQLVWLQTTKDLAYKRATELSYDRPTRLFGNMSHDAFEGIASHLEPPTEAEQPIKLDGTKITPLYISSALGL